MFSCDKHLKSSYGRDFDAISSYAILSKVKLSKIVKALDN